MVSQHVGSKQLIHKSSGHAHEKCSWYNVIPHSGDVPQLRISKDGFCTDTPNPTSFIRVPNFLTQKLCRCGVSNDAIQPFRLLWHTPVTWNNLAVQRSKPCGRNETWKIAEQCWNTKAFSNSAFVLRKQVGFMSLASSFWWNIWNSGARNLYTLKCKMTECQIIVDILYCIFSIEHVSMKWHSKCSVINPSLVAHFKVVSKF